ncbi:MAG: hypothetical protein EOO75_00815, partial [Myxococcales bacterium]
MVVVLAGWASSGCASSGGWAPIPPISDDEAVGTSSGVSVPAASPLTEGFVDGDPSAISDFYPVLAPHGAWHDDPQHGLLWVPDRATVGEGFAPYLTAGHWGLNESQAHVWISDHDDTFGWVVFHYGRWLWTTEHGWAWVPGRTYAPAWVEWRAGVPGDPYVGWGPVPPSFVWRRGRPVGHPEQPVLGVVVPGAVRGQHLIKIADRARITV